MRASTTTNTTQAMRPMWQRTTALLLAAAALAIPAGANADPSDGSYSSLNSITGGSADQSQSAGGADYSSVNSITGGSADQSQPAGGTDYSSVNAITGGLGEPSGGKAVVDEPSRSPVASSGYSSLNAITGASESDPTVASGSPVTVDDGFDWLSAVIGAAAAMSVLALSGAAFLTLRRRTAASLP